MATQDQTKPSTEPSTPPAKPQPDSPWWLLLPALVALVAFAAWEVHVHSPRHIKPGEFLRALVYLTAVYLAPAEPIAGAVVLYRWTKRKQLPLDLSQRRELKKGDITDMDIWQRIKDIVDRWPIAVPLAIIALVVLADGGLAAIVTHIETLAKPTSIFDFIFGTAILVAIFIWAKRKFEWGGGSGPNPLRVGAVMKNLEPPSSGALTWPSRLGLPMPSRQAPAIAVIGPSGSGKTHLLAALAATWPGPVVVASTKPDLFTSAAVGKYIQYRWIGQPAEKAAVVWDLTGQLGDRWPLRTWDPSVVPTGADPDKHAADIATALAKELAGGGGSSAFFATRGEIILTHLLTWGRYRDFTEIVAQLLLCGPKEMDELLSEGSDELESAGERDAAKFLAALRDSLGDPATSRRASDELATAMAALQPLRRLPSGGRGLPTLDLGEWARSTGQLCGVVIPAETGRNVGPLVAAFIQDAVSELRKSQRSRPVLIILDEVSNLAQLPALGTWATELRGWRAYLVVAAQSSRQFVNWDSSQPEKWILQHFPRTLVAAGAPEHTLAEMVSSAHGTRLVTHEMGDAPIYRERRPVIPPEDVFLDSGSPGVWVDLYMGRRVDILQLPMAQEVTAVLQEAVARVEQREARRLERQQQAKRGTQ